MVSVEYYGHNYYVNNVYLYTRAYTLLKWGLGVHVYQIIDLYRYRIGTLIYAAFFMPTTLIDIYCYS